MKDLLALTVQNPSGVIEKLSPPPEIISGPGTTNTIVRFGLNLLVVTGITASLIYMLLAGIKWITSGGDKQKIEEARKGITYSIVGIIIISLSFVIIHLIGEILGVQLLSSFGVK